MYLLIRILEEKKGNQTYKNAKLNSLRNGLVHGFFDVNPEYVIKFVNNNCFKLRNNEPLTQDISKSLLYLSVSKYQSANDAVVDAIENLSSTYMADQVQMICTQQCYSSLVQEQNKVKTFSRLDPDQSQSYPKHPELVKYAILHSIACLGESIQHIRACKLDFQQQVHDIFIQFRNDIFHDKGHVAYDPLIGQVEFVKFTPKIMSDMEQKVKEFDFDHQLQYYNSLIFPPSDAGQQEGMMPSSSTDPISTHFSSSSQEQQMTKNRWETHIERLERKRSPSVDKLLQ